MSADCISRALTTIIVTTTAMISVSGMAATPAPNSYLSAPSGAMTHFDPGQTDAFPEAVPSGTRTAYGPVGVTPQASNGFINFVTLKSTSPNYVWAVSATGVSYLQTSNDAVTQMGATLYFPGSNIIAQSLLT